MFIWTNWPGIRGCFDFFEKSNYFQTPSRIKSFRVCYPQQHRALIRISINRQRNGARIDHVVSVFWKRLGGRNRLLAQTLAHKNFKLVLVCQPGRVISIDCEDNVPSSKLSSERPSSLERSRSALNSKHRSQASRNIFRFIRFFSLESKIRIVFDSISCISIAFGLDRDYFSNNILNYVLSSHCNENMLRSVYKIWSNVQCPLTF